MIRILLAIIWIAVGALPARAGSDDWTVVERMLAAQNPCAALKTRQFGQTIGIDQLEDITLREADLALRDDNVTLSFTGRLACQTLERRAAGRRCFGGGDRRGGAVALRLQRHRPDRAAQRLRRQFAPILQALAPTLQLAIADAARPKLVAGCHGFRGDKG